jgi:hypothetical protein
MKVVFAVWLFVATASSSVFETEKDEAAAFKVLKEHVDTFKTPKKGDARPGSSSSPMDSICDKYTCCSLSDNEKCDLSGMPANQDVMVLPGGTTRCIYSSSTPYAFQVIKGASDKLLFYFQGGGACWNKASSHEKLGLCSTDVSVQSQVGVFDRTNARNRFKDYTIVHLSYCSGDVWGGNTTRDYTDAEGVPVIQVGVQNAQATLNWVVEQQKSGALASTLSELVVMGCSAGSVGTQLWAPTVLRTLKHESAAVVPDSYAGLFPPGSQGPLIRDYGYCDSGLLAPSLVALCRAGKLTLQTINIQSMKDMTEGSRVPYTFVQSKVDIVQQSFYVAIGLTTRNTSAVITPTLFYEGINAVFEQYNPQDPFLVYLLDGDHHCFTNQALYYQVPYCIIITSLLSGLHHTACRLIFFIFFLLLPSSSSPPPPPPSSSSLSSSSSSSSTSPCATQLNSNQTLLASFTPCATQLNSNQTLFVSFRRTSLGRMAKLKLTMKTNLHWLIG